MLNDNSDAKLQQLEGNAGAAFELERNSLLKLLKILQVLKLQTMQKMLKLQKCWSCRSFWSCWNNWAGDYWDYWIGCFKSELNVCVVDTLASANFVPSGIFGESITTTHCIWAGFAIFSSRISNLHSLCWFNVLTTSWGFTDLTLEFERGNFGPTLFPGIHMDLSNDWFIRWMMIESLHLALLNLWTVHGVRRMTELRRLLWNWLAARLAT